MTNSVVQEINELESLLKETDDKYLKAELEYQIQQLNIMLDVMIEQRSK